MPTCGNCDHETDQHDSDGCKAGRLTNDPCACMLRADGAWIGQAVKCRAPGHQVDTTIYGCLLRAGHDGNQHRHRQYRWYANVANPDRTKVADEQVGGGHYRETKLQPWDVIDDYGLDFYEGSALKYLLRWRRKNGLEDLKKCRHYLDKIIERESSAGDVKS